MEEVLDDAKEAKCLINFAMERVKKQKGCIMIFTGESGDGKSYSGTRFLQLWYNKRFAEDFPTANICNRLEEAIMLVRKFERKGEGILIEELSVHAGRRDALTTSNKLWNKFIDVCRIKQAIIIGNCPHISFIDSHFQMMCQVWVNCEKVDFKRKIVLARPLWLQTSPHKKEPYKHSFIDEEGDKITYCFFRLISGELKQTYDKLKDESNEEIFDEILLKLRKNRIDSLKKLGGNILPKREMEAYLLALNGTSYEEGAKEMGLKDADVYYSYLRRAKLRLKDPKYSILLKNTLPTTANVQIPCKKR